MRFVYRPKHPNSDQFGMVDAEIAGPQHMAESACAVIRDEIELTRHMADGKHYTSKAKFRAATKAAGCVEVGNEVQTLLRPRVSIPLSREKRRDEIRRVYRQLSGRQ